MKRLLFISIVLICTALFCSCGYTQLSNWRIQKDLNSISDELKINNENIAKVVKIKNLEQTMLPEADGGVWYGGYADVKYIDIDGNVQTKTLHWSASYVYPRGYKSDDIDNKYTISQGFIFTEYAELKEE